MEMRHPSAGVRILLELAASDGDTARYDATVFTPTERFDYDVAIAAAVAIVARGPDASPAAVELLRAIARATAKDARAVTPPVWPRRVLRWRDRD